MLNSSSYCHFIPYHRRRNVTKKVAADFQLQMESKSNSPSNFFFLCRFGLLSAWRMVGYL